MQIYVICDLHTYLSLWLFLTLEVVFYIFVYFHYLFRLQPLLESTPPVPATPRSETNRTRTADISPEDEPDSTIL
jgi:hypothetical protein